MASVQEAAQKALDNFITGGRGFVDNIAQESQALAKSGQTTIQITLKATKDVANGHLDPEGAQHVLENSFQDLKKLAEAEANLAASLLVDWLKGFADTLLDLAPWLPRIPGFGT